MWSGSLLVFIDSVVIDSEFVCERSWVHTCNRMSVMLFVDVIVT